MSLLPWLLFLHVLAALIAIGPNFAYATIRGMGRKEPVHGNFATRVSHEISDRLVYPVGLIIPITGVAMILVMGIDLTARAFWWLDFAIVLYAGVYLYSFFVQRRIVERIIALTSAPMPNGPPPELPPLAVRAQRGGTAMLILLVIVAGLMVIKPAF